MLDVQNCAQCGAGFIPRRRWQKYCSRFCNQAAYYSRTTPPNVNDLTPQHGPTPTQELEFERRKALPKEHETTTPEDERTIEEARKLLGDKKTESPTTQVLKDWLNKELKE